MQTKHAQNILLCGLAVAAIQVAPVARPSNPPLHPEHSIEATLPVPAEVEAVLNNACKDCHSHETRWPWYARIAPVSWIVSRDVERARRAMNLSEWAIQAGANANTAMGTLMAACAGVESQRMSPAAYRWMHPQARLNSEQVAALCDWTTVQTKLLRKEARRQSRILSVAGNKPGEMGEYHAETN